MTVSLLRRIGLAALAPLCLSSAASAALVVAGSLQTEQGEAADWSPSTSTLIMNDDGGGLYSVTANNLLDGTFYEFKVLDDEGTGPADWGDPEIVNANTMAYGDADGSVSITVDTNQVNGNGGAVVWANTDGAPLQVVGDFQDEAGGAGDWSPADAAFAMTSQGGGYYTFDAVISTPGSYQFKATDGSGWDYQVGPDGFGSNAGTHSFTTTSPNESVTMFVDVANGAIGIAVPEPTTAVLCGLTGLALAARRR
ncbi:hypothetical protein MalM25_19040 [Planctomycetes bacterium MalM25]|nr:hypothetical protein MalM25_19040 [Planctomycetes bacterium MalM25]